MTQEDTFALARRLATEALDLLADGTDHLDAAIRKAVRVAALRGHAAERAFLEWQLISFTDVLADGSRTADDLQAALPEELREQVTEDALLAYVESRTIPETGAVFTGSALELEGVYRDFEAVRLQPATDEFMRSSRNLRFVYERVKNRVHTYLVGVESAQSALQ